MMLGKKNASNRIKRVLRSNKGTTMMETLVAFVVLMVILVALTRVIMFSSELRMRAMDTGRVLQTFNKCLYSNELKTSDQFEMVKKQHYSSAHASDARPGGGVVGPLFYITPDGSSSELWVTEIEANSYTYDDADANNTNENYALPSVMVFEHKKYN